MIVIQLMVNMSTDLQAVALSALPYTLYLLHLLSRPSPFPPPETIFLLPLFDLPSLSATSLSQSILAAILCLVSQLSLKDSTSSFGNRVSAKKGDMERVDEESTIFGLIITTHCEGVVHSTVV